MLVEKYRFHAPLYRQHQKLESSGITISRGTLTHLEQRAGQLLKPIADEVLNSCLEGKTLALDETPGKAGRKSKGKMQKGYFWCFYGDLNEMAFTFSTARSVDVVEPHLKDFKGVLLTDGYAGYDKLCVKYPQITHAQCWTHSRRYFFKAQDEEPEAAKEALEHIGSIYKIEDEIRKAELYHFRFLTTTIQPIHESISWPIDLLQKQGCSKRNCMRLQCHHNFKSSIG